MHLITLDHETDFDGWRRAARALMLNDVPPSEVAWRVRDTREPKAASSETPPGSFSVPAKFVELAKLAIINRSPHRFALLYRLLWRLCRHHDLLMVTEDPDVAEVSAMADAVDRDINRMQENLRFREFGREQNAHFIAAFKPEHHIVESAAPFFASRYADMPWSILTPDACAHWDGHAVTITPGISEMPDANRLEETWQTYCADIFNPARVKTQTARTYSGNQPHAPAIEPQEPPMIRKTVAAKSIATLRAEAASCRACPLWKDATQTVFGEGPAHARLMLVGEQPGDKEDLAGHPFVGPAGNMLDRALAEAGIDREKVYVTNAVKHFKFWARGKIRLHQKPSTPEIKACRPWYERELAAIRPDLVVALGATAAHCVLGKITPINKNRGKLITLDHTTQALVTVHPSYLLRLPDEEAKAREYARFVADLRLAAKLLGSSAHAA
jgi:uracil-DNA glycosylase